MKLIKKMTVLSLAVLALGGCTQSSISSNAPDMVEGVDPAKMNQEEDETLPREENILLENEDEKEPETMYEWEQVTDETNSLFLDTDLYPLAAAFNYTADEEALAISLDWTLKDGATEEDAMDYAVELVKNFNDIIAVQTTDLEASSDTSFGSLWDTFSLDLTIDTEDGTVLLEKSYGASEEIDLVMPEYNDEGPEPVVEEDVPKKA